MSNDPLNLTGTWNGTYTYPGNYGPATPFLATISDVSGAFDGTIIEPNTMHGGETLNAAIAGHRSGQSVDFIKTYRGQRTGYENPVDYVGQLSADGLTITGVWSLLTADGSFEMFRDAALKEAVERSVAESLDI